MSQENPKPIGWTRRLLLSSAAAVALAGAVGATQFGGSEPARAAPVAITQAVQAPISFADLVEKVKPAVVNIATTQKVERRPMPELPFPPDSPYGERFRRFFERQSHDGAPREVQSLGSGFVVDAAGYVVTNNHVVGSADEISVILNDGSRLPATIVGRDDKTDLALLKVESEAPLPYVPFADSDRARVGDWVLAVGNPFGLGGTVTAGIISADGRDINSGPYDDFLQIDAAINRGNSGGPAFNLAGEVVGVNTAIFSPNGGSVGIGFAVPANLARDVVAQLKENGEVRRGWMGVQIQGVTPDMAAALGLDAEKGAIVADVVKGGPAEKAGLRAGDLILRFDGAEIGKARDLPRLVAAAQADAAAKLEVLRDGSRQELTVTVGRMPGSEKTLAATESKAQGGELGLALAPLTSEARAQLGLAGDARGALVRAVRPGSEADRKGLRPGDVIVSVNQKPVGGPGEVVAQVEQARKQERGAVVMLVTREGEPRLLALRLS